MAAPAADNANSRREKPWFFVLTTLIKLTLDSFDFTSK
jgi:hypothetical protein